MQTVILFITCLLAVFDPPAPEISANNKLHYIVIQDGKKVGNITATKSTKGEQVVYEVETHMNIKVLLSQKVDFTSRAVYTNGILQTSLAKSFVNDKLHHSCSIVWKGNRYEIKRDKDMNTLARSINYSGVLLYFREPGNSTRVLSEMSGHENQMIKTAEGQYLLTDHKSGKQNKYWYKSGALDRATISHTLVDLEIKRVNQ